MDGHRVAASAVTYRIPLTGHLTITTPQADALESPPCGHGRDREPDRTRDATRRSVRHEARAVAGRPRGRRRGRPALAAAGRLADGARSSHAWCVGAKPR